MRKLSYLLLAITGLTPFVAGWWVGHVRRVYEAEHGFPPDGKGLLGYIAVGVLVMFVLLLAAASCAALAYQKSPKPCSPMHAVELTAFLLLPVALLAFTYFVILGRG